MGEIAIDVEDIRYYKKMMLDIVKELDILIKQVHHNLETIPQLTTDNDFIKYVNRINVESVKQNLFTTLLEDYANVLATMADKYEDIELQVDTIINQSI